MGKRFEDRQGGLIVVGDFDVYGLADAAFPTGHVCKMAVHEVWSRVQAGDWTPLPDGDKDEMTREAEDNLTAFEGWIRGRAVSTQLRPYCNHHYVNYTPYDSASPMAKWACAKCDKEKS